MTLPSAHAVRRLSPAALCLLVFVQACGKPAEVTIVAPPPQPGIVACFPDSGPIAFSVNGVLVPEATITRLAGFVREINSAYSDDQAKEVAITEAVIPTAVVYAAAQDRIAEWSKRVQDVRNRLSAGADLADVAKAESACPSKEKGGDLGSFTRDKMVLPFSEATFHAEVGAISGPVVTVFGAHVFKVTSKTDGSSAAQDQRRVSHVLIPFDAAAIKDAAAYGKALEDLKRTARVEVKKDAYKKLVPANYRR